MTPSMAGWRPLNAVVSPEKSAVSSQFRRPPRASPTRPKRPLARGSRASKPRFLSISHFSAASIVSWPTPRMVSPVWPVAAVRSSIDRTPVWIAWIIWVAPLAPKMVLASLRAAAESPASMYPLISPVTRWNVACMSSPGLAIPMRPLRIAPSVASASIPALSNTPIMRTLSANPKPSSCMAPAFFWALSASSFMPTPVAWATWNSSSRAPETASPWMPKALKAALVPAMSTSVPRMRPASRYCEATVWSVSPVRPRRVFTSATVVPACSKLVGIVVATPWATSTKPSSASPVAPVPTRIVSSTSSNLAPRS